MKLVSTYKYLDIVDCWDAVKESNLDDRTKTRLDVVTDIMYLWFRGKEPHSIEVDNGCALCVWKFDDGELHLAEEFGSYYMRGITIRRSQAREIRELFCMKCNNDNIHDNLERFFRKMERSAEEKLPRG
jgi:hypothetical protein